MKLRTDINETENEKNKNWEKNQQNKDWLFEKINNINKSLRRLEKK